MNEMPKIASRRRPKAASAPAGPSPAVPGVAAAKTGPRIYNLFPLLTGTASQWAGELPRIAAMNFDWVYVNPFHQSGFSGSLYAIRDTERLDDRFRDPGESADDAQIQAFAQEAGRHGLKVMADLVINHTSKDALLAEQRPDLYVRDETGAIESPFAVDPDDPEKITVWGDLAELDYASEPARDFLVGHWDAYLARMQALGLKGFRCDAAYKVPAQVWTQLITAAKARDPECLFAAETLGCTLDETRAVAGSGFDYLFNSFAWWDLKADWALQQYEALRLAAPSIAFPENHDMARLAAGFVEDDPATVATRLKARYALAGLFSAGVLMPQGYEHGYVKAMHVVETTPADREETGIDISADIAAINSARAEVPVLSVEGAQWRASAPDAPYAALVRLDAGHVQAATQASLVVANLGAEELVVETGPLVASMGGLFGPLQDRTPGGRSDGPAPGEPIRLAPYEVRVLVAERAAPAEVAPSKDPTGEGRLVIETVWPELDGGRTPVKRIVGENVEVWADIFTDGHEKLAADLLYRAAGDAEWRRVPLRFFDNDRYTASFPLERNTRYLFTIEAWRDVYATWRDEVVKKRGAGQKVSLETIEGARIVERSAKLKGAEKPALAALAKQLKTFPEGSPQQLDLLLSAENAALLGRSAERLNVTRYDRTLEVIADRLAARFSAWYEVFPRSMSDDPARHGTFDDVIAKMPYVQSMGFDVLYFTPIHPVGRTNRKGKNNSLTPEPDDVGSVYAIGSEEGGHDALHPQLGSFEDFRRMVSAAHAHGLEIAIDFAIQCSPDHPWIREHPEWFDWRPDGSIKFAENPPKKYEDIVNVHFYRGALPSLWLELKRIVLFWCEQGVRIFRVDNPHTKPLPFWRWMIAEVNAQYPDALFLAEAFTRPKMMRALAKVGYQQSYTYFTWRNTKPEIIEYMTELKGVMGEYYRPNFFANTPDINPVYLQTGGRAAHIVRSTLAATLSSVYGLYNGFELCEATPITGKEEYLDSEKYEIKAWDWDRPGNIREHVTKLNQIRRSNPAFQDFRNITFTGAHNEQVLAYVKMTPSKDNVILVLVNLDPHNRQDCTYEVPLWEFGLPDQAAIEVEDLLGESGRFTLYGKTHRIALDPETRPVVIWRLIPPSQS